MYSLFLLFYGDTTIMGDGEYVEAKGQLLKSFLERTKAQPETEQSKKEDDAVLEEVKKMEEAKANIIQMGKEVADGK